MNLAAPRSLRRAGGLHALFVPGLLSMAIGQAWGQAAPANEPAADGALGKVTVSGQALSIRKAIAEKRYERGVSDGVSADDIGSIPDFGLGEALQRVPGVSMIINNGRGEAQFMTLRGFNPDYNSVLIDGVALPSSETTRRTVSYDVIPSSLASQVTVYKSCTPEMDGNAIGGITNLRTRSAFDKPGTHVSGRAQLSHWTNSPRIRGNSPSGDAEFTASSTFGDQQQFGALLSANVFRRVSSSLNTAIDSYSYYANSGAQTNAQRLNPATSTLDGAIAMPDRLRWLTYDNVRQRRGLFGKLEFDNGEGTQAHLSGGYFQHLNDEDRRAQWLQNTTTATSAINLDAPDGGVLSGRVASGQSQSDFAKFDQDRRLRFLELGGETRPWADGRLQALANLARGSYQQDATLYTFASGNSPALGYRYSDVPGEVPVFTPADNAALHDPARYNQTEATQNRERSRNNVKTLRLTLSHHLDEDDRGWGLKGGLQRRDLAQRYDYDETRYNPAAGRSITLAQVGASPSAVLPYNSDGRTLLLPDPGQAAAYFAANPSAYTLAATNTQNSTQRDFSIDEVIDAGFAMAAYQATGWSTTFGVRAEQARTEVDSFVPQPANQTTTYAPSRQSSRRTDWLPSVNTTWDLSDALRLRAAYSQSLGRPTYASLGQNSSSVTGTTISQTLGNPGLQPRQSRNLDASAEWTPTRDTQLAVAVFHKRIRNEIANLSATTSFDAGGTVFTQNVTQAFNVGTATVAGLEIGATDVRFDFLPAPFNQFGATANLTLMRQDPASVRMANGSDRTMPSLMESPTRIANLSLLWGLGPWSAQLAYNRTGRTLLSVSTSSAAQDVYYAPIDSVDAQLRYAIDSRISLLLQGKNLGNERLRRITGPGAALLNQEIDNGRAVYLGATFAY